MDATGGTNSNVSEHPPYPLLPNTDARESSLAPALTIEAVARRRFAALLVMVGASALLLVAWMLTPSPNGFGTHHALGLPPCSWPERFGVPCPSCGMTTAFAYATKGRFVASFLAQPMGFLLAMGTGMAFVGAAWTLASGRTVWPVFERIWTARGAWFLGLAMLLAWGYKAVIMKWG